MFFWGHNSEFREQNFADKSEHNKRVLQRNSGKDFATFFKGVRERIGRVWVGRKLLWSTPCAREKGAWRSRKNACIWASKKWRKSVYDDCPKLFEKRADAYYSRGKSWPGRRFTPMVEKPTMASFWMAIITTAFSITKTNLHVANRTSTASNVFGVAPNGALQNSTVQPMQNLSYI